MIGTLFPQGVKEMTVGEFAKVFDKKTGFIAVIDSAKNWSTDRRDVSEGGQILDRKSVNLRKMSFQFCTLLGIINIEKFQATQIKDCGADAP